MSVLPTIGGLYRHTVKGTGYVVQAITKDADTLELRVVYLDEEMVQWDRRVSGIDPECLRHPTLSLALPNYCQVLEEAAHQSGCDNFGLYYGQQFKPQALGLLGYIGLCSTTLEQALINMVQTIVNQS